MSKKDKTLEFNTKGGGKLVDIGTRKVTKKGRLKGNSKTETLLLKQICCHHVRNKNGKIRGRVDVHGKVGTCTMCGATFPVEPYTKSEVNDMVKPLIGLANHTIYLATAIGAPEKTIRGIAETKVNINNLKITSKRVNRLVDNTNSKGGKVKNKSKNNGNMYGSWNIGR